MRTSGPSKNAKRLPSATGTNTVRASDRMATIRTSMSKKVSALLVLRRNSFGMALLRPAFDEVLNLADLPVAEQHIGHIEIGLLGAAHGHLQIACAQTQQAVFEEVHMQLLEHDVDAFIRLL